MAICTIIYCRNPWDSLFPNQCSEVQNSVWAGRYFHGNGATQIFPKIKWHRTPKLWPVDGQMRYHSKEGIFLFDFVPPLSPATLPARRKNQDRTVDQLHLVPPYHSAKPQQVGESKRGPKSRSVSND